MSDPEAVAGDDVETSTDSDPVGEEDQRRRPWYGLLVVILLLLLLLCCGITAADLVITRGPEQARFVARNLDCLQCHTELIPDFSRPVVHRPFALEGMHGLSHAARQAGHLDRHPGAGQERRSASGHCSSGSRCGSGSPLGTSLSGGSSSASVVTDERRHGHLQDHQGHRRAEPRISRCPRTSCAGRATAAWARFSATSTSTSRSSRGSAATATTRTRPTTRALLDPGAQHALLHLSPHGRRRLNRMQAHPPAKEGWCIDCHSPHASNNKGILVARAARAVLPLPPVASRSSPTCPSSTSRSSTTTAPAATSRTARTTRRCSCRPSPGSATTAIPAIENQFAQPSHHPIGVELTCGSCHNPHAAQYPGLIDAQDNEFCYQCHGDKQALVRRFGALRHALHPVPHAARIRVRAHSRRRESRTCV